MEDDDAMAERALPPSPPVVIPWTVAGGTVSNGPMAMAEWIAPVGGKWEELGARAEARAIASLRCLNFER